MTLFHQIDFAAAIGLLGLMIVGVLIFILLVAAIAFHWSRKPGEPAFSTPILDDPYYD